MVARLWCPRTCTASCMMSTCALFGATIVEEKVGRLIAATSSAALPLLRVQGFHWACIITELVYMKGGCTRLAVSSFPSRESDYI
jgi:hypothetical protein